MPRKNLRKAETKRRLCPGSHDAPAALFQIRYKFNASPYPRFLGECRHCSHAFSINNNKTIHAHSFHGCMEGIFVPECPRGQAVHIDRYEVLNERRLDDTLELSSGGIFTDG